MKSQSAGSVETVLTGHSPEVEIVSDDLLKFVVHGTFLEAKV